MAITVPPASGPNNGEAVKGMRSGEMIMKNRWKMFIYYAIIINMTNCGILSTFTYSDFWKKAKKPFSEYVIAIAVFS